MPSVVALIPARSGSERVRDKNIRPLARSSAARVRDRDRAPGRHLRPRRLLDGQRRRSPRSRSATAPTCPFLRPAEFATSTSPDIEWITHALEQLDEHYDLFAIVRATNPFRGPDVLRRGLEQLLATPEADSIRAVELVKQHPGKMWVLEGKTMRPLLDQSHLDVAWHAGQYQALPEIYVQNSALEIAWTRVVSQTGTREGRVVAPFLTTRLRGLQHRRRGGLGAGAALVARRGDAAESSGRASVSCARHEGRAARDALLRRRLASRGSS